MPDTSLLDLKVADARNLLAEIGATDLHADGNVWRYFGHLEAMLKIVCDEVEGW